MKMDPHEHVVSGLFASRDQAHHALDALAPTEIDTEDISIITTQEDLEAEEFSNFGSLKVHDEAVHAGKIGGTTGAIVAAVVALTGMILGKVALLPAVLIITAVGGFGGLLGTLIGAGFADEEAKKIDQALREGKVLVAIHAHSHEMARHAANILKECHAQAVHRY